MIAVVFLKVGNPVTRIRFSHPKSERSREWENRKKESERDCGREGKIERTMIMTNGFGLACMSAFCVIIQFLMHDVLWPRKKCKKKKRKERKRKRRWDYKDWNTGRRGNRQRTVLEKLRNRKYVDDGSLCKCRTRLCLLSRASSCMTLATCTNVVPRWDPRVETAIISRAFVCCSTC